MGWLGAINNVHTLAEKFAGEAQIVTAHMGQIMHIRNAELEFLSVGSEDVFPVIINNDNACSLVFRVTFDGINDVRDDGDVDSRHSILIFGDSALDQTYNVYFPLFIDELHGDIIQVAHHGLGGQTSRLTPLIKDEDVSVFCMTWPPATDPEYGDLWYRGQNNGLQPLLLDEDGNPVLNPYNKNKPCGDPNGTTGLNIICDEYVYTLVLPFDWETDPVHKTIINQYKSDFFDYNNVKVAYIPAFRFQNTFDTKQAEILKELASYDADVLVVTQIAQKASRLYENQDMVGVLAKELGYAFYHYTPAWGCDADNDMVNGEYGTVGHLVLSRYPIAKAENITLVEGSPYKTKAEGGYTEGRAAAHVVLDMEGMLVDIYATHFDDAALAKFAQLAATEEYRPAGKYWMIVANNNKGTYENTISALAPVAAGLNNGDYEVYASAGATFSEPKVQTSWAGASGITGNANMGNGYTFTLELSRKVLCDDLEIGEFDDIPSVGQWWVNYLNQATNREQVARWLLKNKHEVVGLVHIPSELLDDEFAAYFAELVGYPYYHVVKIPNPNYGVPYGHMLLSAYPLEPQEDVIIRSEEDSTDKLTAESYGHVIVDMTGTALNTKVDFFFGDMDANDKNGLQMTSQRVALEAAIKAVTDTSGRPFVLLSGYDNGHIKNLETYAGKEFNHQTHPWSNCIVASAPLPMSGREFFGTTAFPENGESPIKISIPNVDPYVKADLAAIPEHQVTVTNGTGDNTYPVGATVTITADAPEKGYAFDKWVVVSGDGVVFSDATSAKTTFTMINGAVEVKATYKDVPVVEKDPTGETKELKVAVMPAFRFAGKFAEGENAAKIVENLLAQSGEELWQQGGTADVLALTLMDYDASCGYNSVDMFATLKEAFKDVYEYAYYAPVWKKGATSETDPAAGYLGHMIFSKYEIVDTETYILNTESGGEVRGVGRATIHVPGAGDTYADVDVFFGHLGSAASWINGETNLYEAVKGSTAEAWLMLGRAYANSVGKAGLEQNLNQSVTSAFGFGGIDIFGSGNLTYKNAGTDKVIYKMFPYKETSSYVDPVYFATVTLPIYEAEGKTKYAVKVEGVNQGFYAAGETVTLTAPNPGVGKRFDSWNLPEGLVLTDNTTAKDKTITFTMPAEILNLTVKNNDVSSFFVYVNGTQVGEYEPGQTVKLTAPGVTTEKVFNGWSGLDVVELKQGYSDKYMTIEFFMPSQDVELTTSTADVNTSAEYPTYSELGTDVQDLKFTYAWGLDSKETVIAKLTESLSKGYNVAVYLNTKLTEAEVAEIAAASGYDYFMYTKGNHFMMSEYPFVHKDTMEYVGGQTRTYNYVTLNVNGTFVDLYFGENTGGNGGAQNKAIVEPWIKHHASQSSNPFFFISYSASSAVTDVFVGLNRDAAANEDGWINLLRSNGTAFVGAEAKSAKFDRGYIYHSSFSVAKKTTYSAASWRVEYADTAPNQTHRDNMKNWMQNIAKSDYVAIAGVDMTKAAAKKNLMAEALAYGYTYYSFVADSATSTRGTLLLSKYPLVEVETFLSGTVQFKQVQMQAYGKTVDIYFGAEPNWSATAYDNTALFAKLDASVQAGNPAVVLGYFVWQSANSYSGQKVTSNSGNTMCVIGVGLKKGANADIPENYVSNWPSEIMNANFAAPAPTHYVYANLMLA
jgi:endonuclease/exonuclease/phosphatase family metal-dependent hydrolase